MDNQITENLDTSKNPIVESTLAMMTTSSNLLKTSMNDSSVDYPIHSQLTNDQMSMFITEQKRQSQLLERIIESINKTNSLLMQLVQR
jgi:oligoribonuclease (3'-5' exoribonuclease)